MADEKRSSHRVRMSGVRVTYGNAGGDVEADALDLSPGGLFIRTAAPLAVGKRLSLEIQVLGEQGPWSVVGRVIWVREKGEGNSAPPGMGVKLIDADDGVIGAIERIVDSREHTEPGVGASTSSPPPAIPQREATVLGVGPSTDVAAFPPAREVRAAVEPAPAPAREPSATPARAPVAAREASVAIDLATRKPSVPPAKSPSVRPSARPPAAGGGGRWIVVLLLLIVAAGAAYVLLDGFLRPTR